MAAREKRLQDRCIRYLKDNGIYYLNLYGDGRSGKGKPDIIACINGRFVAFELKVGLNDMQDDQKIHKIRIERSGGLHYAPYSLEEFIIIVETVQSGKKNDYIKRRDVLDLINHRLGRLDYRKLDVQDELETVYNLVVHLKGIEVSENEH